MKRFRLPVALFLAALPSCPAGDLKDSKYTSAPVTVYTQFDNDHSVLAVEEMKAELEAIMQPVGLHFEWRSLKANRGNEVAVELVVVSFKGTCSAEKSVPVSSEIGPLGWTHMSDGAVLPFSDVQCDRIRRFIRAQLASVRPEQRSRMLGRAMGRVLAHELYHVFANTTRHAAWGIAKGFYTPAELISDTFHFQEKESKTLREGKLRTLLRNPAPVHSALMPAAGQ